MGTQIIKQPNGKYCLFSSISDNVTYYHCTRDELVEAYLGWEKERIEARVDQDLKDLEKGRKTQFSLSYKAMLRTVKSVHGAEKAANLKGLLEPEEIKLEPGELIIYGVSKHFLCYVCQGDINEGVIAVNNSGFGHRHTTCKCPNAGKSNNAHNG